jgi:hypothetical protein
MRDDVRTGDGTFDCGGVTDICRDEICCARPAFGSMTGDPYDIVTLEEQSSCKTAAEHTTSPGDRDSH